MDDTPFEVIVGLEVHAELLTESKIFCGCSTAFGATPNTQVCPVCLGLPGTLPVLNEKAVEYAAKAGLALGCAISLVSRFDRKQYFYPDLPKAYQVSQFDRPLCTDGRVEFMLGGELHVVRIMRVHMEEEAGKSVHSGDSLRDSQYSLIDYNRGGLALIEIVTHPDMHSGDEARLFMERLHTLLRYIEVSDCRMQEGSLRCDANVNLRILSGEQPIRTPIVEIKNLNSLRALERAIDYEAQRQYHEYLDGSWHPGMPSGKVTAGWNDIESRTYVQREKEHADDYRYFPDPDILPVVVREGQVEAWRRQLPELPAAREARFISEYDLPAYDAAVLTASRPIADFFEAVVEQCHDSKMVSNWIMGELLRLLKEAEDDSEHALLSAPITAAGLAQLLLMVKEGRINANSGKEVLEIMYRTGRTAEDIVHERGLEQISDTDKLDRLVAEVIDKHPEVVTEIKGGKVTAIGFLVGQVMKATRGQANPKLVNESLRDRLGVD